MTARRACPDDLLIIAADLEKGAQELREELRFSRRVQAANDATALLAQRREAVATWLREYVAGGDNPYVRGFCSGCGSSGWLRGPDCFACWRTEHDPKRPCKHCGLTFDQHASDETWCEHGYEPRERRAR